MRRRRGARHGVRALGAALAGCVAVVLGVVWVVGGWARDHLLDTDAYVAAVGPLAAEPVVRDEATRLLTAAVDGAVKQQLGENAQNEIVTRLLAAFSQGAREFAASAAFRSLWLQLNRQAHTQLVATLRGDDSPSREVSVESGRLVVDLAPPVRQLERRATAAGIPDLLKIPRRGLVVDVADVSGIQRVRSVVALLDRLTPIAPWGAAAGALLAVALARRRVRAVVLLGLATTAATVLVRLAAEAGLDAGTSAVASTGLSTTASRTVVDSLVGPLVDTAGRGALAGAAVTAAALVVGALLRSRPAPTVGAGRHRLG